jgi:transposase-like protein
MTWQYRKGSMKYKRRHVCPKCFSKELTQTYGKQHYGAMKIHEVPLWEKHFFCRNCGYVWTIGTKLAKPLSHQGV